MGYIYRTTTWPPRGVWVVVLSRGNTRNADAVSALPFTTEFQVKPDRTGL